MSLPRRVDPEWLDELPQADPRAVWSRRDLKRINGWMQEGERRGSPSPPLTDGHRTSPNLRATAPSAALAKRSAALAQCEGLRIVKLRAHTPRLHNQLASRNDFGGCLRFSKGATPRLRRHGAR
jgi:hypothetical protein